MRRRSEDQENSRRLQLEPGLTAPGIEASIKAVMSDE
jgi:hypothetical protein